MIELRLAVSQWKRARCGSWPIGPLPGPPRADRLDGRQVAAHRVQVDLRVEREQPRFVELDARLEELRCRARQDDADVDELLALHARHHADHRVVVVARRVRRVHGSPPRRSAGAAPAAA